MSSWVMNITAMGERIHVPNFNGATVEVCEWIYTAHKKFMNSLTAADTVYPEKYAHGFCFAVLCCGYTLTDFPISVRLTSLALWQSDDCPSASKATLMNMDKYFIWIHYERLHKHNKAKHNKTVCIFLGIYCTTLLTDHFNRSPSEKPCRWISQITFVL